MRAYLVYARRALRLAHDPSHPSAAVIVDRLLDLGLGVHHERAVADDRLIDRLAVEHEQRAVLLRLDHHAAAVALQHRELRLADRRAVAARHRAAQYEQRRGVTGGHVELGTRAGADAQVPDIHGRETVRRSHEDGVLARNAAHRSRAVGQRHARYVRIEYALVTRRRHFVLGRQVDPQLDHFEQAAVLRKLGAMELLVDDAAGRGHPLPVAGADAAAAARRITELDLARIY